MPKALADGNTRLAILAAKPADPDAPTVSELEGGIDASCRVLKSDYRISAAASDTIADAELCAATNAQAYGAGNYEATITPFRYWDATDPGKSDEEGDLVFQALRHKGGIVYVAERMTGLTYDTPWEAGQEVNVYELLLDNPTKAGEAGGYIKYSQAPAVQNAWEFGTVGA
jgi:hypothetical protein